MKTLIKANGLGVKLRSSSTMATLMAATVIAGGISPAYATIDNTATVSGTAPDTSTVTDDDTESVDVEDAAPALVVTKSATVNGTAYTTQELAAGDVVVYTYSVENTGNQTVTDISLADPHDAGAANTLGAFSTPAGDGGNTTASTDAGSDTDWDTLAPGDTVTWTASYTVAQADITNQVGGDGDIANTVTATGFSPADVTGGASVGSVTDDDTLTIDVEPANNSLTVAKVGTVGGTPVDGLTDDLAVGDVVTYTYTIENDGNVPITDITLADVHTSAGTFTQPDIETAAVTNTSGNSTNGAAGDGDWDVLFPGDTLEVTTTYTIVQGDIDNFQ